MPGRKKAPGCSLPPPAVCVFPLQRDHIKEVRAFHCVNKQHGDAFFLLLRHEIRRQLAERAQRQVRCPVRTAVGAVVAGGPQKQTPEQAPAIVGFCQRRVILASALKIHHEAGVRTCHFFAELHGFHAALLDVVHGFHHLAPHARGRNAAAQNIGSEKPLRGFAQKSIKSIYLTGRARKENVHTPVQIIAHLLEAFAHIALHQLGARESGQVCL